jgi:hypothetical protein
MSIKKGEIVWKIFTFTKQQDSFKFWLTCACQFILATIFLAIAIACIFFYEELLVFLAKIS